MTSHNLLLGYSGVRIFGDDLEWKLWNYVGDDNITTLTCYDFGNGVM